MQKSLLSADSVLRVLIIGGERCPSGSVLRSWKADGNNTRVINIYGVTEVSSWASWYEVSESDLQLSKISISFLLITSTVSSCRVVTRAVNNRFKSIQQSESNRIPTEFDLSGRLQTGASSVYLLVTKLVLIALYYKLCISGFD